MNSEAMVALTIVVIVAVMALSALVLFRLRASLVYRLRALIDSGEYEGFFALVDGGAARMVVSPYARRLLLFSAYAKQGDRDRMVEEFNQLMKLNLNSFNRVNVLTEGFREFSFVGDAKRCRRIVQAMKDENVNESCLAAYRQYLDIALEGKTDERRDIEARLPSLTGRRLGYAEFLLARIHESANDHKGAEALYEQAALHMKCSVSDIRRGVNVGTAV